MLYRKPVNSMLPFKKKWGSAKNPSRILNIKTKQDTDDYMISCKVIKDHVAGRCVHRAKIHP
jgi:hypothetical protein